MYFSAAFVASLVVSVSALATPHVAHELNRRHHHAALAKARAPELVAQPSASIHKRESRKRCKPRRTSSSVAASTQSTSEAAQPSDPAPVNVAPLPISIDTTSTSSASHSSSSSSSTPSSSPTPSKAAPKPSPPPSTPAPSPPPPSSGGGSSGGGDPSDPFSGSHTGQGTFYATGLGACGITNKDTDYIAAVSEKLFDKVPGYNHVNPNSNPICGRKVTATFQSKSVTVTITDRCTGCAEFDLDFSPSAFNQIADPSLGRISGVQWTYDS